MKQVNRNEVDKIIDDYLGSSMDMCEPLFALCHTGYPCPEKEDWEHSYLDHQVVGRLLCIKLMVTFTESTASACCDMPNLSPQQGYVYLTMDLEDQELKHFPILSDGDYGHSNEPDWATVFGEEIPHYEDTFVN